MRFCRLLLFFPLLACTRAEVSSTEEHASGLAAQRIVVLGPSTSANLYAMGQGHRVVGVSDYCTVSGAQNTARIGGLADPSLERIVALNPDLILTQGKIPLVEQLCADSDLPFHAFATDTLQEWHDEVSWLGEELGVTKEADALNAKMAEGLASFKNQTEGSPTVLLVIFRNEDEASKIMAAGDRGFLNELLLAAGGQNVLLGSDRDYFDLNEERLLHAAPDLIFEFNTSAREEDRAELNTKALAVWKRDFPSLPATKSGRIFTLIGEDLLIPGPNMLATAEQMQRLLNVK
ncbi:MAG: helical backbone metal receptor [Planctomycetota bacterium]|nr:helical backbone metal receptor [Planctomycetota bacterium]MDA1113131.1 helical backbone metal receptor [Planctomycetota bacterium]